MSRKKIALIIDDDNFFGSILSEVFMQRNFQTLWCSSAEDAFDHLQRGGVSIVLSDIFMPGMGGIKAIEKLKKNYPETKVFAMSGGAEGMEKGMALQAASKIGADAILVKPFTAKDIDVLLQVHGFKNEVMESMAV